LYDEKIKVAKGGSNKAKHNRKVSKNNDSMSRQRANQSKLSSNSPNRKANSGETSQKSFKGGMVAGQNVPGWNKNDYNLMKILANFLYLNVDYFSQQVITRAKEKKIFEIIHFA